MELSGKKLLLIKTSYKLRQSTIVLDSLITFTNIESKKRLLSPELYHKINLLQYNIVLTHSVTNCMSVTKVTDIQFTTTTM